jgi:hypothetical protein
MRTRIWANDHWEVADDGMTALGPVNCFIPLDRLCELRPGKEAKGVASWPLQIAEKSWADLESFLEAYRYALDQLKPKGVEAVDLQLSASLARDIERRRRR